jgi:hypothetical protein
MWPLFFARRRGRIAFMKFTCPKKITSNCRRTRSRVAGLVESSSTVPMTAGRVV